MGDGQKHGLEAVHLRPLLQERDRLLAVRRVMVDESNPLALHLVPAALLRSDELENDVGGSPIGAEQRKIPLEYGAVARLRAAVAHGDDRDLVGRRLLRERKRNASRERDDVRGPSRAFAFEALVALHAAVSRITGVAFLEHDFDAVDAAVAFVDEGVVVGKAIGERNAVRGIGAGPIDQHGYELLILRQRRRSRGQPAEQRRERDGGMSCGQCLANHRHSSIDAPGRCRPAIAGFYPASGGECARELSRPQYGNGHRRSFSLPIAQSRARPCGSAIKKNTIIAPNNMNSIWEIAAVDSENPSHAGSWLRTMGISTMNAAPRKEPRMVPSPPMMIMNSTWNERLTSNAKGSHEPRRRKPHSAPAIPI